MSVQTSSNFKILRGELSGYAISTSGDVFSLVDETFITPLKDKDGVSYVRGIVDKKTRYNLKDIVYTTFISKNVPQGFGIGMKDGNEDNITPENLVLVTKTKNKGRARSLSNDDVIAIRRSYYLGEGMGDSARTNRIRIIAEQYNVSVAVVYAAVKGTGAYQKTTHLGMFGIDVEDFVIVDNPEGKTHNMLGQVIGFDDCRGLIKVALPKKKVVAIRPDRLRKCRRKGSMPRKVAA